MLKLTINILKKIFSKLEYADLINIKLTCKEFNRIASYESLKDLYNIDNINFIHFIFYDSLYGLIQYNKNTVSIVSGSGIISNLKHYESFDKKKYVKITYSKLEDIKIMAKYLVIKDSYISGYLESDEIYLENIKSTYIEILSNAHINIKNCNIKNLYINNILHTNITNYLIKYDTIIDKIPSRLLNEILSYLDFRDLCNCRLVCKHFKKSIDINPDIYLNTAKKYFPITEISPNTIKSLKFIHSSYTCPEKSKFKNLKTTVRKNCMTSIIRGPAPVSYVEKKKSYVDLMEDVNYPEETKITVLAIKNVRFTYNRLDKLDKLFLINCSLIEEKLSIKHIVIEKSDIECTSIYTAFIVFNNSECKDIINIFPIKSSITIKVYYSDISFIYDSKLYKCKKNEIYIFKF